MQTATDENELEDELRRKKRPVTTQPRPGDSSQTQPQNGPSGQTYVDDCDMCLNCCLGCDGDDCGDGGDCYGGGDGDGGGGDCGGGDCGGDCGGGGGDD